MCTNNLVAFLPTFVKSKNVELHNKFTLSQTEVAVIIAIFSAAQLMLAPYTSSLKNFFGTKSSIIGALFVEAMCIVLIGAVSTVNDPFAFKWFAIMLRFVEGLADMLLQVSSYTTITYVFQENVMKYCAITEIFLALGLQFGPFIGEAIYSKLEFRDSLFVFGCMCVFVCSVSMYCLPNSLDKKMEMDISIRDEESNKLTSSNNKEVNWR